MTSGPAVELTLSSKGKSMLKVDNFNFFYQKKCRTTGLYLWKCVKKLCTAQFYTNESYKIIENENNSFFHIHALSRTKLVKRLIFKEVTKVAALRGSSMKTADLINYANKYLKQTFQSTLNASEMENVRKSVRDYCYYYRDQILTNFPSSKTARADGISSERRRLLICKAVEKGILQDEIFDLFDSDISDDGSGSNLTAKEESDGILPDKPIDSRPSQGQLLPNLEHLHPFRETSAIISIEQDFGTSRVSDLPETFYVSDQIEDSRGTQSTSGSLTPLQTSDDPLAYHCTIEASPPTKKARLQPLSAFSLAGPSSQNTTRPQLEPIPQVIHVTDGDTSYQRPFDLSKIRFDDDDDEGFFKNLLPLFGMLPPSGKSMIKAQLHQLVTWKFKNTI